MTRIPLLLLVTALLLGARGAAAAVSVFACEPEWQALAEAVGAGRVEAVSATTAAQDPHHIQARPSLIAKLRGADLLICSGADLEAGWLPLLLRRARNPAVQPGQPGYLMAADHARMLDVPQRLDRSEGDIHALGNPHLHLDPRNVLAVAEVLAQRFAAIDAQHADAYLDALASFRERWTAAMTDWQGRAAGLRGQAVVVHHRQWIYLLDWLGMQRLAALEPKPGVPPSAGHLAALQATLAEHRPLAIIRSPIDDEAPSAWLASRTGVPALVLPYTVGSSEEVTDLFALFDVIVARLGDLQP